MVFIPTFASALVLATAVSASHDAGAKLTKPALEPNLDYLKPALKDALKTTSYTKDKWGDGWIPQECKDIATGKIMTDYAYNPTDFNIWNIHYSDCGDAWVFCHHKQSPVTVDVIAKQFGQLPIQMRQYVRHVVDVPRDGTSAFEYDGTVTFANPTDDLLTVIVHEVGHSLDLNGAYADKPLSESDHWWDNYNQDPNVPDNYAQTNMRENVAQQTVVSVYNENVNGGFGSVEPKWNNLFHQYATLIGEANDAGKGNSLIKPGENVQCTHRLANSETVSMSKKRRSLFSRRNAPNVQLSNNVKVLHTGRVGSAKHSNCTLGH